LQLDAWFVKANARMHKTLRAQQQAVLRPGEIFGDGMAATAMVGPLIHHAEILSLKAAPTASRTATPGTTRSERPIFGSGELDLRPVARRRFVALEPSTSPSFSTNHQRSQPHSRKCYEKRSPRGQSS
jgi:hypothetical protein